jgi:hypothetical protein
MLSAAVMTVVPWLQTTVDEWRIELLLATTEQRASCKRHREETLTMQRRHAVSGRDGFYDKQGALVEYSGGVESGQNSALDNSSSRSGRRLIRSFDKLVDELSQDMGSVDDLGEQTGDARGSWAIGREEPMRPCSGHGGVTPVDTGKGKWHAEAAVAKSEADLLWEGIEGPVPVAEGQPTTAAAVVSGGGGVSGTADTGPAFGHTDGAEALRSSVGGSGNGLHRTGDGESVPSNGAGAGPRPQASDPFTSSTNPTPDGTCNHTANDVSSLPLLGGAADAAAAAEEEEPQRILTGSEADAALIQVNPVRVVFVPLIEQRLVSGSGAPEMLTLDVSADPAARDIIAVVFADQHDARALVAMLGSTPGFRVDDGVRRTVVGMPPAVAMEEALEQGAQVICFRRGFAAQAGVRVGADLKKVLSTMAGSRWAALIEAQLQGATP